MPSLLDALSDRCVVRGTGQLVNTETLDSTGRAMRTRHPSVRNSTGHDAAASASPAVSTMQLIDNLVKALRTAQVYGTLDDEVDDLAMRFSSGPPIDERRTLKAVLWQHGDPARVKDADACVAFGAELSRFETWKTDITAYLVKGAMPVQKGTSCSLDPLSSLLRRCVATAMVPPRGRNQGKQPSREVVTQRVTFLPRARVELFGDARQSAAVPSSACMARDDDQGSHAGLTSQLEDLFSTTDDKQALDARARALAVATLRRNASERNVKAYKTKLAHLPCTSGCASSVSTGTGAVGKRIKATAEGVRPRDDSIDVVSIDGIIFRCQAHVAPAPQSPPPSQLPGSQNQGSGAPSS